MCLNSHDNKWPNLSAVTFTEGFEKKQLPILSPFLASRNPTKPVPTKPRKIGC